MPKSNLLSGRVSLIKLFWPFWKTLQRQPWCAKRCMRACAALCVSHLALTASKERVFFYFTKNDPEELPGRRRLQRRFRDLVTRDRCLRPSEERWQYCRLDISLLFFQPFFALSLTKKSGFLCWNFFTSSHLCWMWNIVLVVAAKSGKQLNGLLLLPREAFSHLLLLLLCLWRTPLGSLSSAVFYIITSKTLATWRRKKEGKRKEQRRTRELLMFFFTNRNLKKKKWEKTNWNPFQEFHLSHIWICQLFGSRKIVEHPRYLSLKF